MTFREKLLTGLLLFPLAAPVGAMTLSEALELARETDPELAALDADLEAELEDSRQLLGTRKPSVNAFGSVDQVRSSTRSETFGSQRDTFTSHALGVEVRQPVFRLDWFNRADRAEALDVQASAGRDARLQAWYLDLAQRYFDALAAAEDLDLARAEAEAVAESLKDTRQRYEVEAVAGTDLREAEARDDLAQARLLAAEQALDDARERLEERTGHVGELPRLAETVEPGELLDGDIDTWTDRAIDQAPDLQVARAAVELAEGEIRASRSERGPSLDLVGSVSRFDNSGSVIGQKGNDAEIGLQLNMPLYQGGQLSSAERQARSRARSAGLELDRLERELRRRVRDAWRAVGIAERQTRAFDSAARSAEVAEEATQNGFEAGTRTITDVLNARSATVEARRDLATARYDLLLAQLAIKQLTGSLTEESFRDFDRMLARH